MREQKPDAIRVKWDHFGQKYRFKVVCHKDEDFWGKVRFFEPCFDGQLSYIDENGKKLSFDIIGGLNEFISKYIRLQAKHVSVHSVPKIASNLEQSSNHMFNTSKNLALYNNIVQASSNQVSDSAKDPKLVTSVIDETAKQSIDAIQKDVGHVSSSASILKEEDRQRKNLVQGKCHFAIVDKGKDRPLLAVKKYPFQYVGHYSEGFYKLTFSLIVGEAREDVFEHWVEADCKLEGAAYLRRVVYPAKNSLSNTSHTISVIFERQEQLKQFICFIREGILLAEQKIN